MRTMASSKMTAKRAVVERETDGSVKAHAMQNRNSPCDTRLKRDRAIYSNQNKQKSQKYSPRDRHPSYLAATDEMTRYDTIASLCERRVIETRWGRGESCSYLFFRKKKKSDASARSHVTAAGERCAIHTMSIR